MTLPNIREIVFPYYSCPACKKLLEGLYGGEPRDDGCWFECERCKVKSPEKSFKIVRVKVKGYLCIRCCKYVPDYALNRSSGNIHCSNCTLDIAFQHPRFGKIPERVLKKITPAIKRRIHWLDSATGILVTTTLWDRLVLQSLNEWALREQESTKTGPFFVRIRNSNGLLLVKSECYVGYLSWDSKNSEIPIVRQLFVLPELRRKGLGLALVDHFGAKMPCILTKTDSDSV